jgi:hypothetical protein
VDIGGDQIKRLHVNPATGVKSVLLNMKV